MRITVDNGKICFGEIPLAIGTLFDEVCELLGMDICAKHCSDSERRGYATVNDVEFYGLKGTATLHFVEQRLLLITVSPEWTKYDLNDEDGNRLPIDIAVSRIAEMSNESLRDEFGQPAERSLYGNCLYYSGSIAITSSIDRFGENYSVVVKSANMRVKEHEKGIGIRACAEDLGRKEAEG